MSEMEKLASLLTEAKIPFLKTDGLICGTQIVYSPNGKKVCDAICNRHSFGGADGLLEIMGLVDEKEIGDAVEGWLTAEEVFNRIKKHWEEHKDVKNT